MLYLSIDTQINKFCIKHNSSKFISLFVFIEHLFDPPPNTQIH